MMVECIFSYCIIFLSIQILKRTNNIFELVSHKSMGVAETDEDYEDDPHQPSRKIHLKGTYIIARIPKVLYIYMMSYY